MGTLLRIDRMESADAPWEALLLSHPPPKGQYYALKLKDYAACFSQVHEKPLKISLFYRDKQSYSQKERKKMADTEVYHVCELRQPSWRSWRESEPEYDADAVSYPLPRELARQGAIDEENLVKVIVAELQQAARDGVFKHRWELFVDFHARESRLQTHWRIWDVAYRGAPRTATYPARGQ